MELFPEAMESLNKMMAQQVKETYKNFATQLDAQLTEQLDQLKKKIKAHGQQPNQGERRFGDVPEDVYLEPKPPDHTMGSTWTSPHKISHPPKSASFSDYISANVLYKFSGKRNYLEWEEDMDDWFYDNHIPREDRLKHALHQLTGDAYKWWCKEVEDRWYYKEPTITSWRELKKLLRDKYAPKTKSRAAQVNTIIQNVQEHRPALAPNRNRATTYMDAKPRLKCVNHETPEAKTTSQPRDINAQVVVHTQRLKPTLESSNEPNQCHTMENENVEAEAKGELNALEKLPDKISSHPTKKQRTRGNYLDSKNRMKPNLLSLGTGQALLKDNQSEREDYYEDLEPQSPNHESCQENSFDIGSLRGLYLADHEELSNELNCSENLTHRSLTANWNQCNSCSDPKVMDFTTRVNQDFRNLDICALQKSFRPIQKDSRDDSTCSIFLSLKGTIPNQFEANIRFGLKGISPTLPVFLRMLNLGLPNNGIIQTYIWRPGECSKIFAYYFKDSFIFENTDMMLLSLSKVSSAGFRTALKRARISEREEDDCFKPPALDQDKNQRIKYFLLIHEEPPDSKFKTKPKKFIFGVRLLIYVCFATDIVSPFYAVSDLRTNPFEEGEDDMITESFSSEEDVPEPEGRITRAKAKEQAKEVRVFDKHGIG